MKRSVNLKGNRWGGASQQAKNLIATLRWLGYTDAQIVEELRKWQADPYAELEQARTERNIMAREAAAERERAARAEGEAAGLLAGYADLQAAAERADAENALLRLTIAGITAHGGSWAEARIKEAIGDE